MRVFALEKPAARANYHRVADEGVPFREVAEIIGRRLKVPVVSKSPEEATSHFDRFAHFAALDHSCSSQRTREVLGWQPKQPRANFGHRPAPLFRNEQT